MPNKSQKSLFFDRHDGHPTDPPPWRFWWEVVFLLVVIVLLCVAITRHPKPNTLEGLPSGDIQNAIDTEQYR